MNKTMDFTKYINLNSEDRFVKTSLLRSSYLSYPESLAPKAINFVPLDDGLELGIVVSQVPEISKAISSILTCSLEDGKCTKGGYLPPEAVERVQLNIISPFGIANLWGITGHRFILSRDAGDDMREIMASVLVAKSKGTIFFLTGRYNNLQHSTVKQTIDLEQPDDKSLIQNISPSPPVLSLVLMDFLYIELYLLKLMVGDYGFVVLKLIVK